ncbi:hypothetical protein F53441_417 [Fusarium austroafricanum]|uniref:Uncharacterized protein n=1 Tax=Fusarium austroafricanum TaxID=2364996 RepID=A0A8H4KYH3_9HYPO|nr:hypothetical protein F53441_417 [Fusarium austroafricanum]
MPCCIAIIQFQQCLHSTLFKLGCTAGCKELCPPSSQQALVITSYLWLCEDCQEREANRDIDVRIEKWENRALEIPSEYPPVVRNASRWLLRYREAHEERLCEKLRVMQAEELQWVAEWTLEYGLMLWDVMFAKQWDPRRAARRIHQLRELRVWDLVVLKDGIRSSKELFEDQSHEAYWTISEQFAEQHQIRRHKKQQLPPPRPPAPPLFPRKEKTPEPERQPNRESNSNTIDHVEEKDTEPVTEQPPATPPRDDYDALDTTAVTT